MERTFQPLTLSTIVEMNRQTIQSSGGSFFEADDNLEFPGALEYVLGAIEGPIFGHDLYPTVIEKAATIGWTIMARHVFRDGNKRTGTLACATFLELNGYDMYIAPDPTLDTELIAMTEGVADHQSINLAGWTRWIEQRTSIISNTPLEKISASTTRTIEQRPLAVLGIAFTGGLLIGWIVSRRIL
ncbi:MAG TPA: type II toxin-antitoxin system death-on-curing family toxin [Pyrinomonadaceae bacterium]|jgi:death-on-curing protein